MNMTTREKHIAITGAIIVAIIIAFQLFLKPAINHTNTLQRVIAEKKQTLTELTAKGKRYETLNAEIEDLRLKITPAPNSENMLSSIEKIQNQCGLKQNITSMTPTTANINEIYNESSVEIVMQKIPLDKLLQFLTKIDSAKSNISVRTLEIKHTPQNQNLLDTTIKLTKISI